MLRVGQVRLRIDHGGARRVAVDEAYRLVLDTTRRTYNRANVLTPVDTGNLRAHNQMTASKTRSGALGVVYNDAEYAAVVHDGSGPYTIRPRTKRALRFVVGGQAVFARSVRHPGTRGRPWLARAGREVAGQSGFTWSPG